MAAVSLTINIQPSNVLPNPGILPAGSYATLTPVRQSGRSSSSSLAKDEQFDCLRAPITSSSTFVFPHLPYPQGPAAKSQQEEPSSYLLDIRTKEYVFAPYRVDISHDGSVVGVWETYRGNAWENRGSEKFVSTQSPAIRDVSFEASAVSRKRFYEERVKCEYFFNIFFALSYGFTEFELTQCAPVSPLDLLKNPMILLALVAMGLMFGMPKLMENSTFNLMLILSLFPFHCRLLPTCICNPI